MKIFYTKTYNLSGANELKQRIIEKTAREMGMEEIALFRFPDSTDNDEELHYRMDGITAAVPDNAIVFFQYPSMVSNRYDRFLIEHLKKRKGLKIVLFVQDLGGIVFQDGYNSLDDEVALFNQADMLILQSEKMEAFLKSKGLKDIPTMFQELWEYPFELCKNSINIERTIEDIKDLSIDNMLRINCSGFGRVSDFVSIYNEICNPAELGFCICAGIPVVAKQESQVSTFVKRYEIGIVTSSVEEARAQIQNLRDTEIVTMKQKLERIKDVISNGIFTKTLLQNAVFKMTIDK